MEEQQYAWQIKQRFNLYRHYLEMELKERGEIVSMGTASMGGDSLSDRKGELSDMDKFSDMDIFPPLPTAAQLAFCDTMKSTDTVKFRDPKTRDGYHTAKPNRESNTSSDSAASWRTGTM